jgi:hypothetical protein
LIEFAQKACCARAGVIKLPPILIPGVDVMEPASKPKPDRSAIPEVVAFPFRSVDKALSLIPLALLVYMVARYAVDVPFLDQWELVPVLDRMYCGTLTFHDLWVQHNEHRIFFPRIIMLLLARLTHWNIRCELALNILFAVGIFVIFAHQIKITCRKQALPGLPWTLPAVSLIIFSVSQYQNWLWGWQLPMFLNLLVVVGGIVLLANEPFRWSKFTAAIGLGIVATYSFGNGTLFWPVGLMILFLLKTRTGEKRRASIIWTLIGALTVGNYFYHYQKPEGYPLLDPVLNVPGEYVAYVFKYIGHICTPDLPSNVPLQGLIACAIGLAGIMATGWTAWILYRRKIAGLDILLPYFGLSLYSLGSALVTGIGRVYLGSNEALASRYCTMATPLWVSLIVFIILLYNRREIVAGAEAADRGSSGCQTIAGWLFLGVVLLLLLGSICAIAGARGLSQKQTRGRNCLLNLAANPQAKIDYTGLADLYPWPQIIVARYPILVQNHLSTFRTQTISTNTN